MRGYVCDIYSIEFFMQVNLIIAAPDPFSDLLPSATTARLFLLAYSNGGVLAEIKLMSGMRVLLCAATLNEFLLTYT